MANQLNDQERADLEYMPKLEYYEYEVDHTGYPSSSCPRRYETCRSTQPTTPAVEEYDHVAQSWYNPEVYKCVCYDDGPGQFFDGQPGLGLDSRFTIDLEGGTMDRLRDVRPYLYYIGWWTAEETWALTGEGWDQSEFEECEPDLVEDGYVRLGREYLLRQQKENVGYFLAKRDWTKYNKEDNSGWPCQALVNTTSTMKGDVGFTAKHDSKDDEKDCIHGVIKTNIRTPLPIARRLVTGPHDEKWDLFIQWMYQPNIHGAKMLMNGSTVYEIHEKRMEEGAGCYNWEEDYFDEKWLLPATACLDNYPTERDAWWFSHITIPDA